MAHFGGLDVHFDDILDFCDFRDVFRANPYFAFEGKMRHFLIPFFFSRQTEHLESITFSSFI